MTELYMNEPGYLVSQELRRHGQQIELDVLLVGVAQLTNIDGKALTAILRDGRADNVSSA